MSRLHWFAAPTLAALSPLAFALGALPAADRSIELDAALRANPDRAYPPSCLSYPLPTTPTGPVSTFIEVRLGNLDGNHEERVTVRLWRVACSGGRSATLIQFVRPSGASTTRFPSVPDAYGSQGSIVRRLLRLSVEPNTYISEQLGHPMVGNATFVLDAIPNSPFNFNQAFTLELVTRLGSQTAIHQLAIPAYNAAQHPDATLALAIGGHVSGSWYDPAHGGEGMIVEVGERASGATYVGFAWYTYDAQGRPTWIVGNQDLPSTPARSVAIPALYLAGGRFAGAFEPNALNAAAWGTVTLSFPSCNAMTLQFASAATAPPGAPTGSGTRNWQRLVSLNGLACE